MSADVAMTKKGFGEMAITATLAGPVFNTLVGVSLSNMASYAGNTSPGPDNKRSEDGVVAGFFETQLKFYYREWLPKNEREKLGIPPKD
jgi:Ca2+/Na+ antiporter